MNKTLIVIIGVALFAWWGLTNKPPYMTVERLQRQYASNNAEFFNDRLPKDIVIDYGENSDEFMATTVRWSDGTFHIALNPRYAGAERVAEYLLLHESCHVAVWDEVHAGSNDKITQKKEHGPAWRACMLNIDAAGGFRQIFIDSFEED